MLTLEDPHRFRKSRDAACYVGLQPWLRASGFVTEDQRSIFNAVSRRLVEDQGAEAIMLGGTDLALAFNEQTAEFRWSTVRAFMPMRLQSWRSLEELRPGSPVLVPITGSATHGSPARRRRAA
jgi:hypothetical protein